MLWWENYGAENLGFPGPNLADWNLGTSPFPNPVVPKLFFLSMQSFL